MSVKDGCTYFIKVAVAPDLPVHKRAGQDATLGVKFGFLAHASPLEPHQLPGGRIRNVDHRQAAAGQPHGRPALSIIHDAQGELAVIVVDLLGASVTIEVDGKKIAAVSLEKKFNRSNLPSKALVIFLEV